MKYFTRERYVALQDFSTDAAMDAADAAWEEAANRYDAYLQQIGPALPPSVRRLVEDFYLHDAAVVSMGMQGDDFVLVLQEDAPPNGLLLLRFSLVGEPGIDREALPPQHRSPSPLWLHEEIEVIGEGSDRQLRFSILLDNGWEITLPIREVQIQALGALFPVPRNGPGTVPLTSVPQTAQG
jgi:hypothetical protein